MMQRSSRREPSPEEVGSQRPWWQRAPLHLALVAAIGLGAYANSFEVPFTWDGIELIQENELIRHASSYTNPGRLYRIEHGHRLLRRYVTFLTFGLNYALHGNNVAGYHAVNLFLHVCNAALLYALILALLATRRLAESRLYKDRHLLAFGAALVFVAHPLQTMAVTYIYQRLALMVTLFYLGIVLVYLRSRLAQTTRKRVLLYAAAILLALISSRTKENIITLPVMLAVVELLFLAGPWWKRALQVMPFFVVVVLQPVARLDRGAGGRYDRATYLYTQFKVLLTYLRMFLFPSGQSVIHEPEVERSLLAVNVLVPGLLLTCLVGFAGWCALRARRGRPELALVAFGLLWFFIAIALESSIFPLHILMQEYRVYLPMAGLASLASGAVLVVALRLSATRGLRLAAIALVVVALVLAGLSFQRNRVWRSPESLWADTVERYPHSARGHFNLGAALVRKKQLAEGVTHLERSAELMPGLFKAHYRLGQVYRGLGKNEQAIKSLEAALALQPFHEQAQTEAGLSYLATGQSGKALEHFRAALALDPTSARANYGCGLAEASLQRFEAAILCFERVRDATPAPPDLSYRLGMAYWEAGERGKAVVQLEAFAEQNPNAHQAINMLGAAYADMKRDEDALKALERAVELAPQDPASLINLAQIYQRLGRDQDALEIFRRLQLLRPDDGQIRALVTELESKPASPATQHLP